MEGVEIMIGLLPEELRRQIKLLETVSAGGSFQIDFLQEQINCSSKTLRNDLIKIANYIDELTIICTGKKGKISVVRSQNFLESSIYQRIMEESIEITYLEKIFISGYQKLEELCSEMFLSESAAKRMIKRINQTLKNIGLKISAGKITAEDPAMLTIFISRLLFEKYQLYENCFPAEWCFFFQTIVQRFIAENHLESHWQALGLREKNHFLIFITCRFFQVKNGILSCTQKEGFNIEQTAAEIQTLLPRKPNFSAEEYAQTMFETEMTAFFLKIPTKKKEQIFKQPSLRKVSEWIGQLEEKLEITCKQKELILTNCFLFLEKNDLRYSMFYDHNEMFLKKIIGRHGVFFETLKKKLEQIYSNETETEFLVKHTLTEIAVNWEELLQVLDLGQIDISGLLVLDGSQHQINYICGILRSELGEIAKINICSEYPLIIEQKNTQRFDFIITNIQLLLKETEEKVFTVSVFPTEDEIKRIAAFCKRTNLDYQLEKAGF